MIEASKAIVNLGVFFVIAIPVACILIEFADRVAGWLKRRSP